MRALLPFEDFEFGKNRGVRLSEVYKYQPSYLEWAIKNVPEFKIDIEAFQKLPKPTPIFYSPNAIVNLVEIDSESMSIEERFELFLKSDTLNRSKEINATVIREMIESGKSSCEEIDYEFPEEIIRINNGKF